MGRECISTESEARRCLLSAHPFKSVNAEKCMETLEVHFEFVADNGAQRCALNYIRFRNATQHVPRSQLPSHASINETKNETYLPETRDDGCEPKLISFIATLSSLKLLLRFRRIVS